MLLILCGESESIVFFKPIIFLFSFLQYNDNSKYYDNHIGLYYIIKVKNTNNIITKKNYNIMQ
jgi:hypothetical protein